MKSFKEILNQGEREREPGREEGVPKKRKDQRGHNNVRETRDELFPRGRIMQE